MHPQAAAATDVVVPVVTGSTDMVPAR
uniref:Uncharacterized protein n=1 Tax=Arundo donax TaxID=35708 RepID=A0A0A9BL46_ARUDO